jgi:hypothetical protein
MPLHEPAVIRIGAIQPYLKFFSGRCGLRDKAGTIPKSFRSAFQNEPGHDSGMKPVTDSDLNPVTFGRLSEP